MARRRPADDKEDDDSPKKKKKKKAVRVAEVEDEDALDELDEADETEPAKTGPRENAYTGLLTITFLSLVAACVLLYLDHSELSATPVSPPSVNLPGLGAMPQQATPAPRGQ